MRKTLFFLALFLTPTAQAEYRVFRLVIKDAETQLTRETLSTLDPFQYVGLHPIKASESIDYIDTWRCRHDTSQMLGFCPSPRAKTDEAPSANTP